MSVYNFTEVQPAGDFNKYWSAIASSADGKVLIAGAGYVVTRDRIFLSTDSGENWAETQPAGDTSQYWHVAAMDADGSHIIVAAYSGRLYTTSNTGLSWIERRPAGDANKNWYSVACSADGSIMCALAFGGRFYMSYDAGETWIEKRPAGNANKNWAAVACNADGSVIFVAIYFGIAYVSLDSGSSWGQVIADSKSITHQTLDMDSSGKNIFHANITLKGQLSTDYGSTWTQVSPSYNYAGVAIADEVGMLLVHSIKAAVSSSNDQGSSWQSESLTGSYFCFALDQWGVRVLVGNYGTTTGGGRLYIGVYQRLILKLNINGNWKPGTPYINIGGEWKTISGMYISDGTNWKQII